MRVALSLVVLISVLVIGVSLVQTSYGLDAWVDITSKLTDTEFISRDR